MVSKKVLLMERLRHHASGVAGKVTTLYIEWCGKRHSAVRLLFLLLLLLGQAVTITVDERVDGCVVEVRVPTEGGGVHHVSTSGQVDFVHVAARTQGPCWVVRTAK